MFKFSAIVLLVFAVYYIQCIPTQTSVSKTKTETGEKLQLYMNNGTEGVNYHLTPILYDLRHEDQQINAEMNAVLPYLNFLFNPDLGGNGSEDCIDQLEVQLVQDI